MLQTSFKLFFFFFLKTGLSRDALAPSGLRVVPLPSGLDGCLATVRSLFSINDMAARWQMTVNEKLFLSTFHTNLHVLPQDKS